MPRAWWGSKISLVVFIFCDNLPRLNFLFMLRVRVLPLICPFSYYGFESLPGSRIGLSTTSVTFFLFRFVSLRARAVCDAMGLPVFASCGARSFRLIIALSVGGLITFMAIFGIFYRNVDGAKLLIHP